jgi:hypothetical protein
VLAFLDGRPFTTGRARFSDHASWPAQTAEIYVRVELQGLGAPLLAQLDTGATWSVLNAEVAAELALLDGNGEPMRLATRRGLVDGRLEEVALTIVADDGRSLEVQAVIFVSPEWHDHTFLGYRGLLERIRFGLDPQEGEFYFGGY